MLEVLKNKRGNPKLKAQWAAWREQRALTLPPEEVERKERHRKYHQKWLDSLTPEQLNRRTEEKRERKREREKIAKEKKGPPSAKTRAK
jgi:hypothetical protein